MSDNILELGDISKSYNHNKPNEIKVLDRANLHIAKSEAVGLIAPSGAGKSTLLHIAGLLDEPDQGVVKIAGLDHAKSNDRKRTNTRLNDIGFVYQFHHLLPEFSAVENVIMPQLQAGRSQREADARARDLLQMVGLEGRANHRPAELSGGEQQRVAICRAVANAPKLLIADEPTGNLDPETSQTVFGVLRNLIEQTGMSALIATHNMELAQELDRVVRIEAGQIS